jgi:hypothetical protein
MDVAAVEKPYDSKRWVEAASITLDMKPVGFPKYAAP